MATTDAVRGWSPARARACRPFAPAGSRRTAAALLMAVAVAMRVVNPGVYSGLFDEGIRVEQLFLMSAGYRPFRDIFAAQGPLLLDLLHPWFVLFGQDLAAARWSVGVYSLVGLAGAYWLARLVGGPLAALTAAALLVLSPLYLEGSRIALAEVPALAPATFAVGAAVIYARGGSRRWLVACAVLLAVSLLMKPITLAAGVPAGLAVLSRWRYGFVRMVVDGLMLGLAGRRCSGCWWCSRSGWPACSTRSWRTGWRVGAARAGASGRTAWRSAGALVRAGGAALDRGRGGSAAAGSPAAGRRAGRVVGCRQRGAAADVLAAPWQAHRGDDPAAGCCGRRRGRQAVALVERRRPIPSGRAVASAWRWRCWSAGTRRRRRPWRPRAANC